MKKTILLFVAIFCVASVYAEQPIGTPINVRERKAWFDFQIAQQVGLNSWNDKQFVSDRLNRPLSTDLRCSFNWRAFGPYAGLFCDLGIAIQPAPERSGFEPGESPDMFPAGKYYVVENNSWGNYDSAFGGGKVTFGAFGKIPTKHHRWTILPYVGVGAMEMQMPYYDYTIKKDGSNTYYHLRSEWGTMDNYYYDGYYGVNSDVMAGFLTGRVNFAYRLGRHSNLLLGLEYTWFFDTIDFCGTYTNYVNGDLVARNVYKGNRMNMIGVSVGISFR